MFSTSNELKSDKDFKEIKLYNILHNYNIIILKNNNYKKYYS